MTADASGTLGIDFGLGGIAVSDNRRIQRLFKVVSGVNPYAANEVYLNETDGTTAVTGLYQLIATQEQLWEINGAKTVKPDTVVIGFPNPAGNGFYFSAPAGSLFGEIPELCVIKSGGNVTDIKIRGTDPVTGETTCETVAECVSSTCSTVWYCTENGPYEVAVGDSPPADWTSGPYETEAEAQVECEYPEVLVSGCATPYPHFITMTFSGFTGGCSGFNGSVELRWDGSSKWTGVYAAPAGNVTCDVTPGAGGGGSVSFTVAYTSSAYTVAGGGGLGSCGAYPGSAVVTLTGGCTGGGTGTLSA